MRFSLENLVGQPEQAQQQQPQHTDVPVQQPPPETPPTEEKKEAVNPNAYIAVDLDGTLAQYDGWQGWEHIGAPVEETVRRVKLWLKLGIHVKVLTARASKVSAELSKTTPDQVKTVIEKWTKEHIGVKLEVITEKDANMLFLIDDSVVQIEKNTGRPIGGDEAFRVFEDRIKENITNISLLEDKPKPEPKKKKEGEGEGEQQPQEQQPAE